MPYLGVRWVLVGGDEVELRIVVRLLGGGWHGQAEVSAFARTCNVQPMDLTIFPWLSRHITSAPLNRPSIAPSATVGARSSRRTFAAGARSSRRTFGPIPQFLFSLHAHNRQPPLLRQPAGGFLHIIDNQPSPPTRGDESFPTSSPRHKSISPQAEMNHFQIQLFPVPRSHFVNWRQLLDDFAKSASLEFERVSSDVFDSSLPDPDFDSVSPMEDALIHQTRTRRESGGSFHCEYKGRFVKHFSKEVRLLSTQQTSSSREGSSLDGKEYSCTNPSTTRAEPDWRVEQNPSTRRAEIVLHEPVRVVHKKQTLFQTKHRTKIPKVSWTPPRPQQTLPPPPNKT